MQKRVALYEEIGIAGTPDLAWERYIPSQRYHCVNLANCTALTTLALTANRLYAIPFVVCGSQKFIRLAVQVTTLVAGKVRLGIYSNKANDVYPDAKLIESGELDTGTTGMKEFVMSQTLSSGLYWLVLVANAAPTLRAAAVASLYPILGLDGSLGTAPGNGYYAAYTYAVLPDLYPIGATINTSSLPVIAMLKE